MKETEVLVSRFLRYLSTAWTRVYLENLLELFAATPKRFIVYSECPLFAVANVAWKAEIYHCALVGNFN